MNAGKSEGAYKTGISFSDLSLSLHLLLPLLAGVEVLLLHFAEGILDLRDLVK